LNGIVPDDVDDALCGCNCGLALGSGFNMESPRMSSSSPVGVRPSLLAMPEMPRVLPFVIFLLVGALAGKTFAGSEYWMYAAKTIGVGALIWFWRRRIPELRWAFSVEAVVVGVAIAVLWLGLSGHIPSIGRIWDLIRQATGGPAAPPPKPLEVWNPVVHFAGQPLLGWAFVMIRVLGRSLVVPALEEVFYRSFMYRFIIKAEFESVAHSTFHLGAFAATSAFFGLSHTDHWVPGLLCGMSYQWLVLRKGRLGDAVVAHAITNLIISGYAIGTGRWEFS
jgi:hypothetical protein